MQPIQCDPMDSFQVRFARSDSLDRRSSERALIRYVCTGSRRNQWIVSAAAAAAVTVVAAVRCRRTDLSASPEALPARSLARGGQLLVERMFTLDCYLSAPTLTLISFSAAQIVSRKSKGTSLSLARSPQQSAPLRYLLLAAPKAILVRAHCKQTRSLSLAWG